MARNTKNEKPCSQLSILAYFKHKHYIYKQVGREQKDFHTVLRAAGGTGTNTTKYPRLT
jgi:hypothetical protein